MKPTFRQIALIGKYHLPVGSGVKPSSKQALQSIAQFLLAQGSDVILERDTASNTGISEYTVMDVDGIGKSCDLALVVGGDGTMLGFGVKFPAEGSQMAGQNERSTPVVMQNAGERITVVWPTNIRTQDPVFPLPKGSVYGA